MALSIFKSLLELFAWSSFIGYQYLIKQFNHEIVSVGCAQAWGTFLRKNQRNPKIISKNTTSKWVNKILIENKYPEKRNTA